MSAPKSVEKRRKLEKQRKRKQEARVRRKGMLRRLRGESVRFDAPGGVRMSDVLKQFIQPFDHLIDGEAAYRRLLTLAVLAWNAALAPDPLQQNMMVDDCFRNAMGPESEELQATGKEFVNQLIARKKSSFSKYRRPILDFVLTDLGDSYHLTVISAVA